MHIQSIIEIFDIYCSYHIRVAEQWSVIPSTHSITGHEYSMNNYEASLVVVNCDGFYRHIVVNTEMIVRIKVHMLL